jgi:hypothetical protein
MGRHRYPRGRDFALAIPHNPGPNRLWRRRVSACGAGQSVFSSDHETRCTVAGSVVMMLDTVAAGTSWRARSSAERLYRRLDVPWMTSSR